MLTRQSDGKQFTDLTAYMEYNAKRQASCKHGSVRAVASIAGEPYPAHIRAAVALKCTRCHAVLHVARTERIPEQLLKGKRFNRR